MKSIRKELLAWLLFGLGILWLTVGSAVYVTVRSSLEGIFDAELRTMASEVRYLLPEGRQLQNPKPSAYWFDFFQPGSGLYFEVWDEYLIFSDRSPSLGEVELFRPAVFSEEPVLWNFTLETGEKVRGIARQFVLAPAAGSGLTPAVDGRDRRINVVVARNRESLDGDLRLLLALTGLVGALTVPVSFLIVRVAAGWGLRPLSAFAEQVASFDMDSLHEQFSTAGVPAELLPIAQRLNELMSRLEAGVEREHRLSADLAHELRTPVAELKTAAEVALTWPDKINSDSYREVLDIAQQMQSIIEGMLLLARWDRGTERPARTRVCVPDILETCWLPYAEAARAKGLQIRRIMPPNIELETNQELFQVILTNLLSNAVEYSPEKGVLLVESQWDEGRFVLSVSNRVENLDQKALSHLFERFWRHDSARSGASHAGLGLSLARACANVLGLNLSVELREPAKTIVFQVSSASGS